MWANDILFQLKDESKLAADSQFRDYWHLTLELLCNKLADVKTESNSLSVNFFGDVEEAKALEKLLLVFVTYSHSSVSNCYFNLILVHRQGVKDAYFAFLFSEL